MSAALDGSASASRTSGSDFAAGERSPRGMEDTLCVARVLLRGFDDAATAVNKGVARLPWGCSNEVDDDAAFTIADELLGRCARPDRRSQCALLEWALCALVHAHRTLKFMHVHLYFAGHSLHSQLLEFRLAGLEAGAQRVFELVTTLIGRWSGDAALASCSAYIGSAAAGSGAAAAPASSRIPVADREAADVLQVRAIRSLTRALLRLSATFSADAHDEDE